MAGYIGSKAVITSGVNASIDELNIMMGLQLQLLNSIHLTV